MDEKKFRKLSGKEKRLVVLNDAIEQVLIGKYAASPGDFAFADAPGQEYPFGPLLPYGPEDKIPKAAFDKRTTCHVCAKGAVAVSALRTGNLNVYGYGEMASRLEGIFPRKLLSDMEETFESELDGLDEQARLYATLDAAKRLPFKMPKRSEVEPAFKKALKAYKNKIKRRKLAAKKRAKK